jgi:hypothetical protein
MTVHPNRPHVVATITTTPDTIDLSWADLDAQVPCRWTEDDTAEPPCDRPAAWVEDEHHATTRPGEPTLCRSVTVCDQHKAEDDELEAWAQRNARTFRCIAHGRYLQSPPRWRRL